MRKAPTPKTFKKLFSLSGNQCAFPKCQIRLVNKKGTLVGQVCHIEAADGGQRDNPSLTDNQRRDFSNLIILCANHHIETNDEEIYTVSVLKKMKAEHESKFLKEPYEPSKSVVEQAKLQFLSQTNINLGSGKQANYQVGEVVINQGMTASEVTGLVDRLFEANFPKLEIVAKEAAEKNIAAFKADFMTEMSEKLSPEEFEKFSNPDIQAGLYQAVYSAARKDSAELRRMLSHLIVKRVKNDQDELKQVVLNEAIPTVAKLTQNQMKILALCFMLKQTSFSMVMPWDIFKGIFEHNIRPLIDFKGSRAEILHLQYAGCGKVEEVFSSDLGDLLKNANPFPFLKPLTSEEIDQYQLPTEIEEGLLINVNGFFHFNVVGKEKLKKKLKEKQFGEERERQLVALYVSKFPTSKEVRERMESEMPWTEELFNRYQDKILSQLTLTSVGMAIAIAYFEKAVGSNLKLDIWIN